MNTYKNYTAAPMKLNLHGRKVHLTALEVSVLLGFSDSEYLDSDGRGTWTFSVLDNAPAAVTAKNFPGIMASLNKKGILVSSPAAHGDPAMTSVADQEVYDMVINTVADSLTAEAMAQEVIQIPAPAQAEEIPAAPAQAEEIPAPAQAEDPAAPAHAWSASVPGELTGEQKDILTNLESEEARKTIAAMFIQSNTEKAPANDMPGAGELTFQLRKVLKALAEEDAQHAGWYIRELIAVSGDYLNKYRGLAGDHQAAGAYNAIAVLARQICV